MNMTNRELLSLLKRTFMSKRQVSLCEAIYRVLPFLHMQHSNILCIHLPSGFPQNQSKFLKKVSDDSGSLSEESSSEDSSTNFQKSGKLIRIEGRDGKYQECMSASDHYMARPKKLDHLTLAQHAGLYVKCTKLPKSVTLVDGVSEHNGDNCNFLTGDPLPKYFETQGGVLFRQRKKPCVVKTHASHKKSGWEEQFSEIQLFYPWRCMDKDLFLNDPEACLKKYEEVKDLIFKVKKKVYPFGMSELSEEMQARNIISDVQSRLQEHVDAAGDQNNLDDELEDQEEVERPDIDFESWVDDQGAENVKADEKFHRIDLHDMDTLLKSARELEDEQLLVLQKVVNLAKSQVKFAKTQKHSDAVEQLLLIVQGGGGVGKSRVIRVCSQWAEYFLRKAGDDPSKPRILIITPTGMAACVIDGITIHAAFDFAFSDEYKGLSDQKMAMFRSKFEHLTLIILDEMSMVSSDMLYNIHHRLTDIKQNTLPFGGISMMFVGDLMQLPPVRSNRFIFERPKSHDYQLIFDEQSLWGLCETVTLTKNHRQKDSSSWMDSLNRFRTGEHDVEDIARLKNRIVKRMSKKQVTFEDACHLFFTNREVNDHNSKMLGNLKTPLVEIEAITRFPKNYHAKIDDHGTIDKTQLAKHLKLKKGARVMVVLNVNTSDSIVNGSLGTVLDILKEEKEGKEWVKCVVVQFDQEKMGQQQRRSHPEISCQYPDGLGTPLFRQKLEYHLPLTKSNAKAHAVKGLVIQFPLKLAFAITGHKMQGQTVKKDSKVVVHWHNRMPAGLAYVMISRSETLDDIHIEGKFDESKIRCVPRAYVETNRLAQESLTTVLDPEISSQRFAFLNIMSLKKHSEDLKKDFKLLSCDTIFAMETRRNDQDPSVNLEGFYEAHANQSNGKGTSVFFKGDCHI